MFVAVEDCTNHLEANSLKHVFVIELSLNASLDKVEEVARLDQFADEGV